MTKISTLDLFCGAGGFSTGFDLTQHYQIIGGVDFEHSMEKSYFENHKNSKFYHYDIRKEIPQQITDLDIDLIIGSPPCQGFSDARGVRYRLDEKNDLVLHYFRWLKQLQPKIALMENVKGMTTIGKAWKKIDDPFNQKELDFMDLLKSIAQESNYNFLHKTLNAYYYGVPQLRERVFCIMTRKDLNITPSLPIPRDHYNIKSKSLDSFFMDSKNTNINKSVKFIEPISKTSIKDAFVGLSEPQQFKNGSNFKLNESVDIEVSEKKTLYDKFVLNSTKTHNNIARYAEGETKTIIERIPQGLTYRSDRRGIKHIGVWDLFSDELTTEEKNALKEISILRTRKNVKTKIGKHTEGYVPFSALKNTVSKKTLEKLVMDGFLQHSLYCKLSEEYRKKMNEGDEFIGNNDILKKNDLIILDRIRKMEKEIFDHSTGGIPTYRLGIQWNTLERLKNEKLVEILEFNDDYDLTTKAGLRGKYSRLDYNTQSRTLMTAFTNISELVHPKASRGLSLREGARLMSFPDSFIFHGSFSQVSLQIGNAVAPLVAYIIAEHMYENIFSGL